MSIKKYIAAFLTAGMMLSFVPATAFAASTGWQGNDSDGWRYYTSDSVYVKSDWKQIGGKWYYFNDSGYMATGWLQDGGKWYYLRSNGSMIANSWAVIEGKLYFFNQSGLMETNKWIACGTFNVYGQEKEFYDYNSRFNKAELDKYIGQKLWRYVGSNGAAYVGWQKVGGQWYHFNDLNLTANELSERADISQYNYAAFAVMTYRSFYDLQENKMYYFDENGIYLKNCWHKDFYNHWYYFESNGHAAYGWKEIGGKWYLFSGYGDGDRFNMTRGFYESYSNVTTDKDGYVTGYKIFYLDEQSGERKSGWFKVRDTWYYADPDGDLYKERWFYSGGKWYYFGRLGKMAQNATTYEIEGKGYDFDENGACLNPYDGKKITGWYKRIYEDASRYNNDHSEGRYDWSYFDEDGNMIKDTDGYEIDGLLYDFNTHGVCKNSYEPYTIDIAVPVD